MPPTALELLLGPDRRKIVAPDRKMLEDSLCALKQDENCWATLSWGISDYITVTPSAVGRFNVEVELGSPDCHNRISGDPLSLQDVILIFLCYAGKDPRWMDKYAWERVPLAKIDFRKAPETLQGKDPPHL